MKTLAIVQARMTSTRLPRKVIKPVGGLPMIVFQLKRISISTSIDKVIVATSDHPSDDQLASLIESEGYCVFRGPLEDVLARFHSCCKAENPEVVIRLTGDCPLTDPHLIDEMVSEFYTGSWDYLANCADEDNLSVPDGFDIEIFKADLLDRAVNEAKLPSEREHVTPWFRRPDSALNWSHYIHKTIRPYYRVTVDESTDFDVVCRIVDSFDHENGFLGVDEVVRFLNDNPSIASINLKTIRNEGYLKSQAMDKTGLIQSPPSTGQNLWSRAKGVIPGGNMLLSKRAEMFLPEQWPAYFSRASGCHVWDLDGRKLIDMSIMGIGTNVLGYGHPEVDSAVRAVVNWQYEHP